MQVIVFPDAATIITTDLNDQLANFGSSAPVYGAVPNPRPNLFVVVRRVGGPSRDIVIDDALITVDAYGPDSGDAHDLAQLCRGITHTMPGRVPQIRKVVDVGGPSDLPDPLTDLPRFTFTIQVSTRGVAATGS